MLDFQGTFDKEKLLLKYGGKKFSKVIGGRYREKTAPHLRRQLLRVNLKPDVFSTMKNTMWKIESKINSDKYI